MQTTYNAFPNEAVAGLVASDSLRDVVSCNNPDHILYFGRVVAFDGAYDKVKPYNETDAAGAGVTLKDDKQVDKYFPVKSTVPVMKIGRIWVEAEESMDFGDDVYVVFDGREQIQTITFDAEFVADNVITMTVNGEAVSVTYAASHDNTMDLLIAAIEAIDGVGSVTDGGAGSLVLTVTAEVNGVDVTIADVLVEGGLSQPTGVVAETVSGITNENAYGKLRTDADTDRADEVTGAITVIKGSQDGDGNYLALIEFAMVGGS